MSFINQVNRVNGQIIANGIDSQGVPLQIGTNTASVINIGNSTVPINIGGLPYIPGGGSEPTIPQSVAFFPGNTSASIAYCGN